MSTTMTAAVHLGPTYTENLEVYKNTHFEELPNLFDITHEIPNVTTIDWTTPSWAISALTHDQVITWTKAKVRVYSGSVLCMQTMSAIQTRIEDGTIKLKNFDSLMRAENHFGLMENRLSSSGIFPKTYVIGDAPGRLARSKY